MTRALERHQIALYLATISAGAAVSMAVPGASALETAINPVLGLLLFATFLGVPLLSLGRAVRDLRFLAAVGVLNFVVVPVVAFALSRFVAGDEALVVGVLLVLLPVYLLLFAGPGVLALIDPAPFVQAFVWLIALPLAAAAVVQWGARRSPALGAVPVAAQTAMVPLLMATLLLVVASQLRGVVGSLGSLAAVVPLYAAFLVVMVPLGIVTARVARLEVASARALVFSGATRNSLVVLALALPLSGALALVPFVVVTQTLVELVGMLVLIRMVPRLVPAAERGGAARR